MKKRAVVTRGCVACGYCAKVCPLGAISIVKGMYAKVDESCCVGCRKCAIVCPAHIIEIREVEN